MDAIWHVSDLTQIQAPHKHLKHSGYKGGMFKGVRPMTALQQALTIVFRWEGGYYVNPPADHGCATTKGITQRVYDRYREIRGLEAQAVERISDDEVREIGNCHRLRSTLDLAHSHTAVNMGIKRTTRIFQEGSGCTVDGTFGPASLAAVGSRELRPTLERCCDIREGAPSKSRIRRCSSRAGSTA